MSSQVEPAADRRPAGRLRRELRWWEAAALSIAGAAPTVSMAFSGPGAAALVGRAAALSFVFAAVTCMFIGYAFMMLARKYSNAGNVYGFVGASMGPRSGFFAGWAMVLMYFVFIVASISASGFFVADLFRDLHWWAGADFIYFSLAISAVVWVAASGLAKHSTRALLYIEGASVALLVAIMILILIRVGTGHGMNHGTLTISVFELPSGVNIHALVLGAIFGFLAFTGFEAAGAMGEEATNPGRAIPRALATAIAAVAIFYVACIAVQSLGFGTNAAGSTAFASSSGPLFQLSDFYANSAVRDLILVGAAFSAFGAGLSEAVAGSRLLLAISRDGLPSSPIARVSQPSGAPRAAVAVLMVADVLLLIATRLMSVSGFTMWQYLGTLGTLAILVGYGLVCVGATRAAFTGQLPYAKALGIVPLIGVALVGYTLYNELYPAPAYPYNIFPYVALAWLLAGTAIILFAPGLARKIGTGLTSSLGLTARGTTETHPLPTQSE